MKESYEELRESKLIEVNREKEKTESAFDTSFKQEEGQLEESREIVTEKKEEQLIADGFKTASMKDDIDELEGPVPGEPQYVGMSAKFAFYQEGDSPRMQMVRDALKALHDPQGYGQNISRAKALDNLVKACNKYSSGRFRIFKWGKARQRLKEVLELKRQAEQERDELLNSKSNYELIANQGESNYKDIYYGAVAGAGIPKKIIGGVTAFLGFTLGNLFKLATLQPLWREKITWKPGVYYYNTIKGLDRVFGRNKIVDVYDEKGEKIGEKVEKQYDTSTSLKDKIKSQTLEADEFQLSDWRKYDDFLEPGQDPQEFVEEGYDNDDRLLDVKSELTEEYNKAVLDQKKIARLEEELRERSLKANKLMAFMSKYRPSVGFNMDPHIPYDTELFKARQKHFKLNSRDVGDSGNLSSMHANQRVNLSVAVCDWIKPEWIESGEIPEDVMEEKIREHYKLTRGEEEEIDENELAKLKENFKKRFGESVMAAKTYQMSYYHLGDEDVAHNAEEQKKINGSKIGGGGGYYRDLKNGVYGLDYLTKEEKEERISDIADNLSQKTTLERELEELRQAEKKDVNAIDQKEMEIEENNKEFEKLMKPIIQKGIDMRDFSKYEFKDNEEMLAKMGMFTEELNYGFCLSSLTDSMYASDAGLSDEEYIRAKACSLTLQSVKALYDNTAYELMSVFHFTLDDSYYQEASQQEKKEIIDNYSITDSDDLDCATKYITNHESIIEDRKATYDSQGNPVFHGNDIQKVYELCLEKAKEDLQRKKKL